jgi:hypothetical protein
VRNDEEDSDDSASAGSEVHMLWCEEIHSETEILEVQMASEDESVFLDSCASKTLFLIRDQSILESFRHELRTIQTTKTDVQMRSQGIGKFQDFTDIIVCNEIVKNICSAGYLRKMGYGLKLLRVPRIVKLDAAETPVMTATYAANGMPYVSLMKLLLLPKVTDEDRDVSDEDVEVHLSDKPVTDPFTLLHSRCGHVSKSVLIQGYRQMLFTGSRLRQHHMTKRYLKEISRGLCKPCAKAKITRRSFHAKPVTEMQATHFLQKVTVDISIYLNCPSRQGYKYALVFTDIATKMFWEYPLSTRSGPEVFRCLKHLCETVLTGYEGDFQIQNYHADGGKELITDQIKSYMLDKFGAKTTWSSTDTPELNSVSERKFRTLGEMTLAMLADSGLPSSFWWDAYETACYIARRMPTRTYKGYMSPFECVPGGSVPNISNLRRWGCKAYVLIPKADRRKDWEDKAQIGWFIGYSRDKIGWRVMLGDTVVTSVHVLFDEDIPERSADYFEELDQLTVKTDPVERDEKDFQYLVGKYHMEDGLLFKTTRVVVRRGLIVGFRCLVTAGRPQTEDKTPIHIADLQSMTEGFSQQLRLKKSSSQDAETSGDDSMTAGEHSLPAAQSESLPESDEIPCDQLESATNSDENSKRVRKRRVLINAKSLGDIHLVEEKLLWDNLDYCWLTDMSSYREPETWQESLDCPECKEWRKARAAERSALWKKDVMEVTLRPKGAKPLKSRYVYKRKYNRDGSIKKYKARLVILGYGQVQGIDVFNTFAPVVKSITVRLILALAFIFDMHVHQLDVSNAFCYAKIDGDVYIEPTPDFQLPPGHCFKLNKCLYGLRSSPRSWWKMLNRFITDDLKFQPCVLEPCLYHCMHNGELMLILIYVDDILLVCRNLDFLKEIKDRFCDKFEMSDLSELRHFLNVRVTRTRQYLHLDQSVYLGKIIEKHAHYVGQKKRKSPLPSDVLKQLAEEQTDLNPEEQEFLDNFPYRTLVGATLHLAMNTRPDISYAVGVLSRFGSSPTLTACHAMIHLLQYLSATLDKGIRFSGRMFDLHIFTDADWAGCLISRKSTTGYIVFAAGGPIVWQSKLQATVATSSMQSEYQAMYAGMTEVIWLRGVCAEIGLVLNEATPFFIDSKSAQDLALNPVYHKRSKHIEATYHMIREHVDPEGLFRTARMIHVFTDSQYADMFTKSVVGANFLKQRTRNLGEEKKSSSEVEEESRIAKRQRKA